MKKFFVTVFVVTLMIGITGIANVYALDIIVDGDVDDWGITVASNNASSWTPFEGIAYSEDEDQFDDTSNSGQVYPGYGGQRYDAEGLYVTYDADNLYLLVVTGLRPQGWDWTPGDIAIAFDNDITHAEFGVETTGPNAGGLYKVTTWGNSPYWGGASDPTEIEAGTLVGTNELVYQQIDGAGQHYAIETKVDLSLFGDFWQNNGTLDAHWTMTCGNDAVDIDPITISTVPEPGTLLLLGAGLIGLLAFGRRRIKK